MVTTRDIVDATPIRERLRRTPTGAVVLERLARGAGATRWYYIETQADLDALVPGLRPGSMVSFFFDGRIGYHVASPELAETVRSVIARTGDALVGVLGVEPLEIDMEFVAGPRELAEVLGLLGSASGVFVGAYPGADNDGVDAVTVVVPDSDGVVRSHPH